VEFQELLRAAITIPSDLPVVAIPFSILVSQLHQEAVAPDLPPYAPAILYYLEEAIEEQQARIMIP
jgi:hypothetical protein